MKEKDEIKCDKCCINPYYISVYDDNSDNFEDEILLCKDCYTKGLKDR